MVTILQYRKSKSISEKSYNSSYQDEEMSFVFFLKKSEMSCMALNESYCTFFFMYFATFSIIALSMKRRTF